MDNRAKPRNREFPGGARGDRHAAQSRLSGQDTGRRVLVVEDGPTLTQGGMAFGAGCLVDPRPYAAGSLNRTFRQYPHLEPLLPAMGYGPEQVHELEETVEGVECDLVVIATPMDLRRLIRITKPTVRVRYDVEDGGAPDVGGRLAGRHRQGETIMNPFRSATLQ